MSGRLGGRCVSSGSFSDCGGFEVIYRQNFWYVIIAAAPRSTELLCRLTRGVITSSVKGQRSSSLWARRGPQLECRSPRKRDYSHIGGSILLQCRYTMLFNPQHSPQPRCHRSAGRRRSESDGGGIRNICGTVGRKICFSFCGRDEIGY